MRMSKVIVSGFVLLDDVMEDAGGWTRA